MFLVVADHDSRVFGASLVPVRHFHIPALILGPNVPAKRDEQLISQIDLPPTLLSLIGISSTHPMLGARGEPPGFDQGQAPHRPYR